MSRPTHAPEHPLAAGAAGATGERPPRWTATRSLVTACGALVLVSLVAPALGGRPADAARAGGETAAGLTAATATTTAAAGRPSASASTRPEPAGSGSTGTTASTSPSIGPTATAVPLRGSGRTRLVPVPGADSGALGRTVRYVVEVEDGAGVDATEFATVVREVLTDARGWETHDKVHFVALSPEQAGRTRPDVRITLASPATVDAMCAPLQTDGEVSCRNGDRVAINSRRWTQGVEHYPNDLRHYRIYLINHEVGHAIGHDHEGCPGAGKPAPVMLQQTLGLQGCTRYPWPVPGRPA